MSCLRIAFIVCAAPTVAALMLLSVDLQQGAARAETSGPQDAKHDELKQNFLNEHELEHVPPELNRQDSHGVLDRRFYRH